MIFKLLQLLTKLVQGSSYNLDNLNLTAEDISPPPIYTTMPPLPWTVTVDKASGIYVDDFQDQVLDNDWMGYEYTAGNWGFFSSVHEGEIN